MTYQWFKHIPTIYSHDPIYVAKIKGIIQTILDSPFRVVNVSITCENKNVFTITVPVMGNTKPLRIENIEEDPIETLCMDWLEDMDGCNFELTRGEENIPIVYDLVRSNLGDKFNLKIIKPLCLMEHAIPDYEDWSEKKEAFGEHIAIKAKCGQVISVSKFLLNQRGYQGLKEIPDLSSFTYETLNYFVKYIYMGPEEFFETYECKEIPFENLFSLAEVLQSLVLNNTLIKLLQAKLANDNSDILELNEENAIILKHWEKFSRGKNWLGYGCILRMITEFKKNFRSEAEIIRDYLDEFPNKPSRTFKYQGMSMTTGSKEIFCKRFDSKLQLELQKLGFIFIVRGFRKPKIVQKDIDLVYNVIPGGDETDYFTEPNWILIHSPSPSITKGAYYCGKYVENKGVSPLSKSEEELMNQKNIKPISENYNLEIFTKFFKTHGY